MNYPLLEMTQKEYDAIPRGKDMKNDDIKYVPIGFMFKTKQNEKIVGKVVKGLDALADQAGAAIFSLPERFVNRYEVKIVE
jgi:hypothetical protein